MAIIRASRRSGISRCWCDRATTPIPNAKPGFDALVGLSTKVSGTPHPAVLSIWSSASDKFPNFGKQNDHDWVLDEKVDGLAISIIVAGKVEG